MVLNTRECFWFGTEDRAGWFATPLRGADSSPSSWGVDGTLLSGGGYGFHAFGSHKRYTYEWPQSSSPQVAQMMKSYRDGTYGRGLLYFLEPGIYTTNVLPAAWADPSIAINHEGPSLVYGQDPIGIPTSGGFNLGLPVVSAQYDLSSITPKASPTPDSSVFIPVPEGHTLFLGAFYSAEGSAGVYATPVNSNGTLGTSVKLTQKTNADTTVVTDRFSGDIRGIRLWVGRTDDTGTTITLTAMCGRLLQTSDTASSTPWQEQARNLFTNPSFESAGATVEIRRNLMPNPLPANTTNFNTSGTATILPGGGVNNRAVTAQTAYIFSAPTLTGATAGRVYAFRAQVRGDSGTAVTSLLPRPHKRAVNTYYVPDGGATSYPANGQWQDVAFFWTATETIAPGDMFELSLLSVGTAPIGFNMAMRNILIEDVGTVAPTNVPPFFSAGNSGDPDFNAAFVGTVNNSPTALTATSATGVTAANGYAVRSSRWAAKGSYSLRLVPSSTTTQVSASFTAPVDATHIATSWLDVPLTGSLGSLGGTLRRANTTVVSDQRPNTPGIYTHRIYTPAATGNLEFWGGRLGEGDIWLDMLTIVAGNYSGGQFDGSSVAGTADLERYSWTGPVDASASVYETRTKTGNEAKENLLTAGPWIGGQGHSGCRFLGTPSYVNNGPVEGGRVGFAASFVEVGSWVYG